MQRIILIHAYRREAQRWERLLRAHEFAEVTVALTASAAHKALGQSAATLIIDVSAAEMLGAQIDMWLRQRAHLPPVVLTAETSEALLPYGTLPLAVRLTWQEARQSLPQWLRLTLQLHAAKNGDTQEKRVIPPPQPEALSWERWLPWLTEYFDPATHFARETLFLEALIDLAATAQREGENLTVITLALDAWEKRLKHWHPRETLSIRQEVARIMARQTASLSPFLAAPEPGLFWLALVGGSLEDALVIAENLRQMLPKNLPMGMTASMGVATFPITERHDSGHDVLGAAMDALREARSRGTSQVHVALTLPVQQKTA